jgi:hypothetical protein
VGRSVENACTLVSKTPAAANPKIVQSFLDSCMAWQALAQVHLFMHSKFSTYFVIVNLEPLFLGSATHRNHRTPGAA